MQGDQLGSYSIKCTHHTGGRELGLPAGVSATSCVIGDESLSWPWKGRRT
jgi:hypothetical protein